jgi:hypothetical protein
MLLEKADCIGGHSVEGTFAGTCRGVTGRRSDLAYCHWRRSEVGTEHNGRGGCYVSGAIGPSGFYADFIRAISIDVSAVSGPTSRY